MQTARRYDPTKDAKFHVSIATTEEVRRKWATPLSEWTGPKGTVQAASAPDEITKAETVTPTPSGDATIGLSPAVNFAGRSRWAEVARRATMRIHRQTCHGSIARK